MWGCFVAHLCIVFFFFFWVPVVVVGAAVQVMDLLGDDAIEGEDEDEEGL